MGERLAHGRGYFWTDEEDAMLRELWLAGVPARKIVDKFPERTRNAIIGRVHRLKLKRIVPDKGTEVPPARIQLPPRVRSHPFKPKAPVVMCEVQPSLFPEEPQESVSLLDLKWYHCRSVTDSRGSDGLVTYCGKRTIDGKSFCSYHAALYYVPASQRLRRRA